MQSDAHTPDAVSDRPIRGRFVMPPPTTVLGKDKPNLVLGLCSGYKFEQVEGFVASLLGLKAYIELYLFANDMDKQFYDVARRFGIGLRDASGYLTPEIHPIVSRFMMYRDFLAAEGDRYAAVMLTDVRDVFFQGNPFSVPFPQEVCFVAEDIKIGGNEVNARWIEDIAGATVLRELGSCQVSCAGTTLGTPAGIRTYVSTMCQQIAVMEFDRRRVYDQAIHNYVLWKLRPPWAALDPDDRIVNTVGCTSAERIRIDGGSVYVDEKFSPVIHQWDRHAKLVQHVSTHPRFRIDGLHRRSAAYPP